jgi:nuclear pore complex protein Nup210
MKTLYQLFKLVFTLCILTNQLNAYKLNVPKVLLPFHSSKLISFVLEAKSETSDLTDEPCFVWSSSRPDIVSITPIYEKTKQKQKEEGCSSKATVSAVSKHSQRLTSIILAKETSNNLQQKKLNHFFF